MEDDPNIRTHEAICCTKVLEVKEGHILARDSFHGVLTTNLIKKVVARGKFNEKNVLSSARTIHTTYPRDMVLNLFACVF